MSIPPFHSQLCMIVKITYNDIEKKDLLSNNWRYNLSLDFSGPLSSSQTFRQMFPIIPLFTLATVKGYLNSRTDHMVGLNRLIFYAYLNLLRLCWYVPMHVLAFYFSSILFPLDLLSFEIDVFTLSNSVQNV